MYAGFSALGIARASQKMLKSNRLSGFERSKKRNPFLAFLESDSPSPYADTDDFEDPYPEIEEGENEEEAKEDELPVKRGPPFDKCMKKMKEKCFATKEWGLNDTVSLPSIFNVINRFAMGMRRSSAKKNSWIHNLKKGEI